MRKIAFNCLVVLLTMSLLSSHSLAATYCMAKKKTKISYASEMYYSVECSSGLKFSSKSVLIGVYLPLPYNWTKYARKNLASVMDSKGLNEVALIPQMRSDKNNRFQNEEPILVFSDSNVKEEFLVLNYNERKNQGADNQSTFDFTYATQLGNMSETFYGYRGDELSTIIKKMGYAKAFSTNNNQLTFMQTIGLYKK